MSDKTPKEILDAEQQYQRAVIERVKRADELSLAKRGEQLANERLHQAIMDTAPNLFNQDGDVE